MPGVIAMLEHVLRRIGVRRERRRPRRYSAGCRSVGVIELAAELRAGARRRRRQHRQRPSTSAVTTRGQFSPNTVINDARQRWLFRMVHSQRPLQEKMALFWHNHFATAYSKVNGTFGSVHAHQDDGRASPTEVAGEQRGQISCSATWRPAASRAAHRGGAGSGDAGVARRPHQHAARPQENFGREVMELFTIGVGHYTEADVYAAARVFTGWNLRLAGDRATPETSATTSSSTTPTSTTPPPRRSRFAIYPDGAQDDSRARRRPRAMQDGLDLIRALARHPATADRLARSCYASSSARSTAPDDARRSASMREHLPAERRQHQGDAACGCSRPRRSSRRPSSRATRWPVEFVVRAIKEIGWNGLSVDAAMTPLVNMGQQLFEPPDVNGWALGPEWFSTASMLSRMNFAATLMAQPAVQSRPRARAVPRSTPEARARLHAEALHATRRSSRDVYNALLEYRAAGRRVDGQRRAAEQQGRRPGAPDRRLVRVPVQLRERAMRFTQTAVRPRRRLGVHASASPRRSSSPTRAGAGRAGAQPRRPVSRRRQRRAQHAGPVRRRRLLQPAADDRRAGGQRAADRHRSRRQRARPASAPHRAEGDLRPGTPGGHPAHRLPELEPLALPGLRHLGHGESRRRRRAPGWLGRYLDTLPSPVDPLVGWNTTRETPRALVARTVGVPAITNPATYSFASPNSGAEAGSSAPRP